ncbi:uncharacterized protein LOC110849291 isoform X2 [Folsomia candida]|uniref:uncharacterized protein LOC110849291 isoform X2 n=1 Tax=Folsomia candida TaxID=158441 RepID=UPI001604C1B4|nr:uncharacterized protein LOC110849291 isoform X2 [Folsomia candida]
MEDTTYNPCLCLSVRTGSFLISIIDVIYGAGYIGRVFLLRDMVGTYRDFYPQMLNTTLMSTVVSRDEVQFANYGLTIFSGIALFIGTRLASGKALRACYIWLVCRLYLTLVFSMLCYVLIGSENELYEIYGIEVVFFLLLHAYFFVVVFIFTKQLRMDIRIIKMSAKSKQQRTRVQLKLGKALQAQDIHKANLHEFCPELYLKTLATYRRNSRESVRYLEPRRGDDEEWSEQRYRSILSGNVSPSGSLMSNLSLNPSVFETPSNLKVNAGKSGQRNPSPTTAAQQKQPQVHSVLKPGVYKTGTDPEVEGKRRLRFSEAAPATTTLPRDMEQDILRENLMSRNPAASKFKKLYLNNEFIIILPKSSRSKSKHDFE